MIRDPEGDPLTVELNTTNTIGRVTAGANNVFTYDPNGQFDDLRANQTAFDTFLYTIRDGRGGSDTALVTIIITGPEHSARGSQRRGVHQRGNRDHDQRRCSMTRSWTGRH